MFDRHFEDAADVPATPSEVFDYIDDHARFSSHMNESSWMMLGSRMSTRVDDGKGRVVGSHIFMNGRVLGLRLELDEIVTVHEPPRAKTWQTVGKPMLLVIGRYRMGVKIQPTSNGSHFTVFIDYAFPSGRWTYWLSRLFGGVYARWCVKQMLNGVVGHFVPPKAIATAAAANR